MSSNTDTIDMALHQHGLLDDEGYLVPPSHPNVNALTQKMLVLLEMIENGLQLTSNDNANLKSMRRAFDYYNETLEDEAGVLEAGDDEEEDDSYSTAEDDSGSEEDNSSSD